jgi:hypothetical protein
MARQIRSPVMTSPLRWALAHEACALHNLPDEHDIIVGIVDANLQIREWGITAPWDTRRHISNHAHNAALAAAAGRTTGRTTMVVPGPNTADQDTCTPADRPHNMPITPHESAAIHRLP